MASVLLAIGCDNGNGGTDGGGMTDAGTMPGTDACATCGTDSGHMTNPDSGPTDDGNNSFATAVEITLGAADPTMDAINPPGDLDYFKFDGTAGQWIEILTTANPDDDPEMVDTVITLFDSDMNQIAENDDSLPRVSTDSELTTRLPADGTYYVLVQEWSTWADETPEGAASFTYDLRVGEINPDVPIINVDSEGGNDAASAQALTEQPADAGPGAGTSFILGTFADASDVDVFSFTIEGADPANYSFNLMPSGTTGNGSAASPAHLRITNADGTETIASLDPSAFEPLDPGAFVELNPSLPPGDYLLFVEGGTDADFYVIKAFRNTVDNPAEDDDVMNTDPLTPDTIGLEDNPQAPEGMIRRSGYILAHLGTADIDHFLLEGVFADETVSVFCASRTNGSGVLDLTATLLDSTGTNDIAHATETATEGVLIDSAAVPAEGNYIVRLTKSGQDAEITGDWIRCGFHLDHPVP